MNITEIKEAYAAGTLPRDLNSLMAIQDKVDLLARSKEEDPAEMLQISVAVDRIIDELIV